MADHNTNIFVYRGELPPPFNVSHVRITRAIIDTSITVIEDEAFRETPFVYLEFHNGIIKIGKLAFMRTPLSGRIELPGVKIVDDAAFYCCPRLTDVDLPKAERLGMSALHTCISLRSVALPNVRIIDAYALYGCENLTDVELPKLESMGEIAFSGCRSLRRIAIPLKNDLFVFNSRDNRYNQFDGCENLRTVDLVGGIHKTLSQLQLESWRDEIKKEINCINERILPCISSRGKTDAIQGWIQRVIDRIEHFKAEHNLFLIEATTLIELALWKANLIKENNLEDTFQAKVNINVGDERKERRVTCGAEIVIKNVLPFLRLEE